MPKQIIIQFPDGQQVLFGGTGPGSGLAEVGFGDEINNVTADVFKSALGALGEVTKTIQESVGTLPTRPDKVELEFGATLTADCKLLIVSGKGDYAIKVKLTWE